MKNLLLIILSFTVPLIAIAGGPWPQEKSKYYIKLSEWWSIFDQHYTDTGDLDPNITTGIFNTSLYAEYGISNRLTTIVSGALLSRNYMNNLKSQTTQELIVEGEAINTLGDIDLGLKYGLTKAGAKFPVSVSLILGLPLGTASGGQFGNLQTGDGEFNQILQFDFGTGFKIAKSEAYFAGYTGFNNRTNQFSEEFRFGAEFGIGLFQKKLWVNSKLNAIESFKNGATAESVTSTSLFANNSEFLSLALEANYYLSENFGISLGTAAAIRGEIIAAAPSYSIGIFYDVK